jgi:hypothetical protein
LLRAYISTSYHFFENSLELSISQGGTLYKFDRFHLAFD